MPLTVQALSILNAWTFVTIVGTSDGVVTSAGTVTGTSSGDFNVTSGGVTTVSSFLPPPAVGFYADVIDFSAPGTTGNVNITTTGAVAGNGFNINSCNIRMQDGDLTINAVGTGGANNHGVRIDKALNPFGINMFIEAQGTGNVTINGTATATGGSGFVSGFGVDTSFHSINIRTTGSGDTTVTGTSAASHGITDPVAISTPTTAIRATGTGNVIVTGTSTAAGFSGFFEASGPANGVRFCLCKLQILAREI